MAYSFWKTFIIGQNLKHHHMNYFLELLIFFQLTLQCLDFISDHAKAILHVNKQTSWETKHEIKANILTCFWWCWKKRFFNVKLNLFMNYFYKHIFQSSRLQMFFKTSAHKMFAILKIKTRLQHRCFRLRSSHMILTYW